MLFPTYRIHRTKILVAAFALIALVVVLFIPTHSTEASCLSITGFDIKECTAGFMNIWLTIMSWLVGFAGLLLNFVLKYTVVQMSEHIKNISSIGLVWKTVRDITNMFFIFILLYASIKLILGDRTFAQTTIKNLIIIALFINFSLFGTKVLIDASNLATMTFYNAIAPGAAEDGTYLSGLSESFVGPLKIQSIYSVDGTETEIGFFQIINVGFMGSIFMIVTTFIFLAVAFFFLSRYVILIMALMLSPIAFLSLVIPGLGGIAKQWKDAMWSQLTFAPVFMFLAWVVVVIIHDPNFLGNEAVNHSIRDGLIGSASSNGVPTPGGLSIIINFFIAIALMIIALTSAKTISSKASGVAGKLVGWAGDAAGASTFGMGGRFARGTIGRAGEALGSSRTLHAMALNGGVSGAAARLTLAVGKKTGSTNFDARGGLDGFGKAQKGGFAGDVKDKEKNRQALVKGLGTTDKEKRENAIVLKAAEKEHTDAADQETAAKNAVAEAKAQEAAVKAALDARRAEVLATADTQVERPAELGLAEERAREAQEAVDEATRMSGGATIASDKTEEARVAREEVERLKQEYNQKKEIFVADKTRAEAEAHTAAITTREAAEAAANIAKTKKQDAKNKIDAAKNLNQGRDRGQLAADDKEEQLKAVAKNRFRPSTHRVFLFGKIKKESENAPEIIRKAAKGKSAKDEFAEAATKLAEENKKNEEAEEPETPPAPPAAPAPAPSTPNTP